jgi:hypothetical protein
MLDSVGSSLDLRLRTGDGKIHILAIGLVE